jgi:RHS repeat-associated protein
MNRNVIAAALRHLATPVRRGSLLRRAAPILFGVLVTAGSAIPPATPRAIPLIPTIPVALAGYPCSSHAGEWTNFSGYLSNSTGTMLAESTSGDVYGRISNVDRIWQPTPGCGYYRYDGIVWATTNDSTHLTVDYGAMSGDGQGCTFLLNTSDYMNSDSGSCGAPSPKLVATISPEGSYHLDSALNSLGDFAYAHSDCITWYGVEPIKTNITTSVTSGEPGANCGNKSTESTGTSQTLVVDGTVPTVSFSFPATGGPVLVPSAFAGVTFTATDAVAGFGGTDDWDLQRQKATWSGSACGTFANDTGADALVSGVTNAANLVSSQGLALNTCYRWTLSARDQNGNVASTITSGSIRTDTSNAWGDQPQFQLEGWDLGAGDSLAVSMGSGNLRATHPIVSLPIVGGTLDLQATYNSHDAASTGIGPGWRLNVQRRLAVNGDGSVTFTDADGSRHTFTSPTGSPTVTYTRPATLYATLTRDTGATPDRFSLTYRDQSKDIFDEDISNSGLLKQIKDRHGNTTSIAYTAGTAKISTITDPSSRVINFSWTGSNLTQIVDWANVSSGVVQTSGSGNRTHRFFYDGSGYLIGWADPLNTSTSCPTAGSHVTCLSYNSGLLSAVAKTQTYETFSAGTLGTATRVMSTSVGYEFADVISITDAEGATATFAHPAAGENRVTRPGAPASQTTYALVSPTDSYGRIDSVKRKLSAAEIETETTFETIYPIEPAIITQNKGGGVAEHITNFTYLASSLALRTRLDEPLDGTFRRYSDFTYNTNNDVTSANVYSTDAATDHSETRYCYTTSGCSTSATDLLLRSTIENYVDGTAGGSNGHVEDITTAYTYDGTGQRTRQTRSNYSGSSLLDSAATGWTYDGYGNVTAEIQNYSNGTVSSPGDDITPNGATNARTDLITAYAYDTAGNRVSSADPRRAIETALGTSLGADDYISRTVVDALNQTVTTRLPTTPAITDCGSPPGCREATTTYDELGQVREAADINDLLTAIKYDKAGRALETYEDPAAAAAVTTSVSSYDALGRALTSKDQRQVGSASLGVTDYDYDELGRVTDLTEAGGSSPDLSSVTHTTYDNLNRRASEEVGYGTGTGQVTVWTYDIGGRTTKVDDEFTCTTTTYDYRNLTLNVVEGQTSGSCSGSGLRTTTNTYDGEARMTNSAITAGDHSGDVLAAPTYDAAGNQLSTSASTASVTTSSTFTFNALDQQVAEIRSDAGSATSWTKTNVDAADNPTDRCIWNSNPSSELCKVAGSSYTTAPATSSTSAYDARNQRVSLNIPSIGETTYDAAHNYQVAAIYVPTASGKEHQSLYSYDSLHRLTGLAQQLCTISSGHACSSTIATGSDIYAYDDNDNRTRVNENNGNGGLDQYYCYDALNRLTSRGSTNCTTGTPESYTYDDAGNRTAAGSTTFTYDAQGQLASCSPTCGTIAYDTAGRTSQWNGWYLTYEGEGRLASACKVSLCATGDKVTMRYDAQGHRVELVTRPSGGSDTTTSFRYQGDAIAQELVAGTVTRTYVADESGAIVKFCDPDCSGSNPQYLVTWNGHGDAASIWKVDASTGALTLANSFTYTTWGAPATTTHNSIADLAFRFLYVGRAGVAWDSTFGLGLEYMSARHYSPTLGRFLQPDPSSAEANLYSYGDNNPVTNVDPTGTMAMRGEGVGYVPWGWTDFMPRGLAGFPSIGARISGATMAALLLYLRNGWIDMPTRGSRLHYSAGLVALITSLDRAIKNGKGPKGPGGKPAGWRVDPGHVGIDLPHVHVNGGAIDIPTGRVRGGSHSLDDPLTNEQKRFLRKHGVPVK